MKRKVFLLLIGSIVVVLSGQLLAKPVYQLGHILLNTSGSKITFASGGTGYNSGEWSVLSYSGTDWYVQWFENDAGNRKIDMSVTFLDYTDTTPSADAVIFHSDSGYSGHTAPPTNDSDIAQGSIQNWNTAVSPDVVSGSVTVSNYTPEWIGVGIKGQDVRAYEMTMTSVPEPATIALLGIGCGFVAARRKK